MSRSVDTIPWQRRELWQEMEVSLLTGARNISTKDGSRLCSLTEKIAVQYESIEENLTRLCNYCCPSCDDVCCRHATVWYDFRDLLFSLFNRKVLPAEQICTFEDGGCIHLALDGCRLSRVERPFICTWYVCPQQKELLGREVEKVRFDFEDSLEEIKRLRIQLEELFCSCL
jgi:hypothetical protein